MTIHEALQHMESTLRSAGIPDPHTDTGLLLAHIVSLPRLTLPLYSTQELTTEQEQRLSSLLLLRASRKPLQYILGEQFFYGLPFFVDERVLIPRPETETLCELALNYLHTLPAPQVLDLCTGSGAIAVTLAHQCPKAAVTACDLSEPALLVARSNAERHQARVSFLQGDLFLPVQGQRFHCIASNPPYIESDACPGLQAEVLREPVMALDGGIDGLLYYRRIAREAAAHLEPGGLLCMEIGDTQGAAVCALLAHTGQYMNIATHTDLSGRPRVVACHSASPT